MEKYYIDKDIKLFYVTATSFPEGVGGAFQKLLSFLRGFAKVGYSVILSFAWP